MSKKEESKKSLFKEVLRGHLDDGICDSSLFPYTFNYFWGEGEVKFNKCDFKKMHKLIMIDQLILVSKEIEAELL